MCVCVFVGICGCCVGCLGDGVCVGVCVCVVGEDVDACVWVVWLFVSLWVGMCMVGGYALCGCVCYIPPTLDIT